MRQTVSMHPVPTCRHQVCPFACPAQGETDPHIAHPPVVSSASRILSHPFSPSPLHAICETIVGLTDVRFASERKIDSIEHQLDEITTLLHELKTQAHPIGNNSNAESGESRPLVAWDSASPDTNQSFPPEKARATIVEGESSLSAHSVFVNNFLHSFSDTMQPDPEIQMTMNTLSRIAGTSTLQSETSKSALPNAKASSLVRQRKFNLPPIQDAVKLIQAAQGELVFAQTEKFGLPGTNFIHYKLRVLLGQDGYTNTY